MARDNARTRSSRSKRKLLSFQVSPISRARKRFNIPNVRTSLVTLRSCITYTRDLDNSRPFYISIYVCVCVRERLLLLLLRKYAEAFDKI